MLPQYTITNDERKYLLSKSLNKHDNFAHHLIMVYKPKISKTELCFRLLLVLIYAATILKLTSKI